MNLYAMVGAGIGSPEAAALRARLVAWHDAMVAHERKIRAGRAERVCDDECPHAEARHLWSEAVETFGDGAQGLTFLRTRATDAAKASRRVVPSNEARVRTATAERSDRSAGAASQAREQRLAAERALDAVLADSFPASDPPPWTLGVSLRREDQAPRASPTRGSARGAVGPRSAPAES